MKNGDRHNIFVVDSQPIVRDGLMRIVSKQEDLNICGEASDTVDALRQIKSLKPDLVIVEFPVNESNGLDFPKSFRNLFPNVPLLIFTTLPESLYAERSLRLGANGYVMKREPAHLVIEAIRRVLSGRTYVSSLLNEQLLQKLCGPGQGMHLSIKEQLSAREFNVFELIGQGYNTRKISEELNMSMKTVEAHRLHIKTKLRLSDTVSLVQRAIQWVHYESNGLVKSL